MVKHLTTIGAVILCVLVASVAPAADLLFEDWEGGVGGWILDPGDGGGVDIQVDADLAFGGTLSLNSANQSQGGHNNARNRDYATTTVNTTGETRVNVIWWYHPDRREDMEFEDFMNLEYSIDGGATYTGIWVFFSGQGGPNGGADNDERDWFPAFASLPVDALNQAEVWIRWGFKDSANQEWYAIDDIYVGDQGPGLPTVGTVLQEVWGDRGGGAMGDLTGRWEYPDFPTVSQPLGSPAGAGTPGQLQTQIDWADSYGQRLRSYIVPPTDGDYTFWCVSDDDSRLYLSTDDNPANAVEIAGTFGWASSNQWDSGNVQTGTVSLVGGQRYYFEMAMKEGGGGDNLSAGWQGPGITGDDERPIPLTRFEFVSPVNGVLRQSPGGGYSGGYPLLTSFTIHLDAMAGVSSSGSLSVTETLPAGVAVGVNPVVTAGTASVVGNVIQWDVPDVGGVSQRCTYEVFIDVPGFNLEPTGTWVSGCLSGNILGSRIPYRLSMQTPAIWRIQQADDDWVNAPIPWTAEVNLGNVRRGEFINYLIADDMYQMAAASDDMWGNNDDLRLLYADVPGDFTIEATFEFTRTTANWNKMGVMFRRSAAHNDAVVSVHITEDRAGFPGESDPQGIQVGYRATQGGNMGAPVPMQVNWGAARLMITRQELSPTTAGSTLIAVYVDPMDPAPGVSGLRQMWETVIPNTDPLAGPGVVGLAIVGNNGQHKPHGDVRNVSLTSGTTLLGTDATASRAFSGAESYTAGGAAVPVSLFVTTADVTGTVIVTETLPVGWTANITAVSAGTTATAANVITWTVNTTTDTQRQLNYDAIPPGGECNSVTFSGVYNTGSLNFAVSGPDTLNQLGGQPWNAGPIAWLNSANINATAGYSEWFACDGRYEVTGAGGDIWGGSDGFEYLWMYVQGDCSVSADVELGRGGDYLPLNNTWVKAGLMLRESGDHNAAYMAALIRNGSGDRRTRIQYRDSAGAGSTAQDFPGIVNFAPPPDVNLTLSRAGTMVTATAMEGATAVPLSRDMPNLRNVALLGLAITSHDEPNLTTCQFRNVIVSAVSYTPTLADGTRTFGAPIATVGVPLQVILTVPHLANATTVTIEDTLPGNMLPQNPGPGGVVNGQTVTFTVAPWNATTSVTYEALPLAGAFAPYNITGGWAEDDAGWRVTIPDSVIPQTGVFAMFQQGVWPDSSYAGTIDTHIIENTPDSDQGAWHHMEQGDWFGGLDDHKSILIRFELSSVSPAAVPTIDRALLNLYFDQERRFGGSHVEAHEIRSWKLLRQWGEGDYDGSDGDTATTGESSWNSARANIDAWELAGAMGNTDVDGTPEPSKWWSSVLPQWVELDVTRTAKEMIATSPTNFGWKVSQDKLSGVPQNTPGNEFAQGAWDAASRSNGNAVIRPLLVLLDNTAYDGWLASASRSTLSDLGPNTWVYGSDRVVTVTLTVTAKGTGQSIVVRDSVPPGWEIVAVLDGGSEPTTGTAEWTVAPWTMAGATVRYTCRDVSWTTTELIPPPVSFTNGTVTEIVGGVLNVPDTHLLHGGLLALQQGVLPDATYDGCQDAHVIVHSGGNNNTGGEMFLEEGHWGAPEGDHKKVLVQFDAPPAGLPGIASGADVIEAELLLYYDHNRSGGNPDHEVRAQRILQPWDQGTGATGSDGSDVALVGEVTWNDVAYTTDASNLWGIAGLMLGGTDVSNFGDPSNTFGTATGVWVHLDVTNDVRAFIDGTRTFYGWKVSQDKVLNVADNITTPVLNDYVSDANGAAFDFTSSENADAIHRPMLLIKTAAFVPVEVSRFMLY